MFPVNASSVRLSSQTQTIAREHRVAATTTMGKRLTSQDNVVVKIHFILSKVIGHHTSFVLEV